jgi:hypothetical protein
MPATSTGRPVHRLSGRTDASTAAWRPKDVQIPSDMNASILGAPVRHRDAAHRKLASSSVGPVSS